MKLTPGMGSTGVGLLIVWSVLSSKELLPTAPTQEVG